MWIFEGDFSHGGHKGDELAEWLQRYITALIDVMLGTRGQHFSYSGRKRNQRGCPLSLER
jgi:hypothetical protein